MTWRTLLLTGLLVSCQAPKLERTPRIFVPDSPLFSLIRLHAEGDKCEGEVIILDGQAVCVVPLEETEKKFQCLPNDDAGMIFEYINTLIYRCKSWSKGK